MYIEYRTPPRAPIPSLVAIFEDDVKPWCQQYNVPITVSGDYRASTIRLTFKEARHITLFLLSYTPRKYSTKWTRVIDVSGV